MRRVLIGSLLGCLLVLGSRPVRCTAAESVADPAALGELLKLFSARRHSHVTFTEVQELAILDQPLHSSGELLYDAPDRLEKRTLEPRSEDLRLEQGVLTLERDHHRRSVALREFPPALPFIESLRATLAGDRAALERYFTLHFSGSLDRWTLELAPTDAALTRHVRLVRIAGEHDHIRSVQIRHSDGDTSTLAIGPEITP